MQGRLEDGAGVNSLLYNRAPRRGWSRCTGRDEGAGNSEPRLERAKGRLFSTQKTRTPGHLTARERRPGAGMAIGKKVEVWEVFLFSFYFSPSFPDALLLAVEIYIEDQYKGAQTRGFISWSRWRFRLEAIRCVRDERETLMGAICLP